MIRFDKMCKGAETFVAISQEIEDINFRTQRIWVIKTQET